MVRKRISARAVRLDALVAAYAPIGKRNKRKQVIRRAFTAAGCALVVGGGTLLSFSDITLLEELGSTMSTTTMSRDDADRFNRQQAQIAATLAELERQITGVKTQKQDLETQQAKLVEQSEMLARLLDEAGAEQTDLEKQQQQGSQLDQEIAAIAAQRKALEERWAQFEAQGELLAMEIIAVNAQRKELESQRRQIDRQKQELAEMLKRADGLYQSSTKSDDTEASTDASTTAADADSFIYTNNSLVVDNTELDAMRGGFTVGDGLDVSFGFSETGSINGVEQYSNSFSIDSLASGMGDVDMSNMNSVLVQNGTGNFVSASVLDSLADSFGNIIQNTLDDQVISTTTIYDISLHNMPGTLQGLSGEQALMDSLGSFR